MDHDVNGSHHLATMTHQHQPGPGRRQECRMEAMQALMRLKGENFRPEAAAMESRTVSRWGATVGRQIAVGFL